MFRFAQYSILLLCTALATTFAVMWVQSYRSCDDYVFLANNFSPWWHIESGPHYNSGDFGGCNFAYRDDWDRECVDIGVKARSDVRVNYGAIYLKTDCRMPKKTVYTEFFYSGLRYHQVIKPKFRGMCGVGDPTSSAEGQITSEADANFYDSTTPGTVEMRVPLWIPFTMFSFYPCTFFAISAIRRLSRHWRGACLRCGYDLTGNVSGTCPECGTKMSHRQRCHTGESR